MTYMPVSATFLLKNSILGLVVGATIRCWTDDTWSLNCRRIVFYRDMARLTSRGVSRTDAYFRHWQNYSTLQLLYGRQEARLSFDVVGTGYDTIRYDILFALKNW